MDCDAIRKKQTIIAVCGSKNSGKTTLLVKLIEALSKKGIKTAVIKHDGHDFSCDVPGTDSCKLHEAGAYGIAVFSENRIFIHKEDGTEKEKGLIKQFPEADIIFLEGMKDSDYPKIEVVRKAISKEPVSNINGRFLIATDWDENFFDETVINMNDIDSIVEKIEQICKVYEF